MNSPLIGFVPCRAGSERVKNKNTRPFGGHENGLLELKLLQLKEVSGLAEIIVSSNDERVLEYAYEFGRSRDSRIVPIERPEEWGNSATSMGDFIAQYIANLRVDGDIFWTHVTHPFVTADTYSRAIASYREAVDRGYDCLISATKIQKFLWRDGKPFNYDNTAEKWPRSQDITPVYEINHAIYAMPFSLMREVGDRVGRVPFFFEMREGDSMDIDWEDQFHLMDEISRARILKGVSLI